MCKHVYLISIIVTLKKGNRSLATGIELKSPNSIISKLSILIL